MASQSASSDDSESVLKKMLPRLGLSLGLGALFAWLIARGGVPLLPSWDGIARVDPQLFGIYLVVLVSMHVVRAARWRFLIAPAKPDVPFWQGILINWVGFFAIFVLPLRIGELARPAVSKMRLGVPISVGFGTVAVERVFDGLLTSLCVVWGLAFLPQLETEDPIARSLPYYGWLAVTGFGAAFTGLVLFLWQQELAKKLVGWTFGLFSKSLAERVSEKVMGIAHGIHSIARPKLALGFLSESLVYWGLNATGMWILARACGLDLSFGHAAALMGILAIGVLLPAGPGMFGNFQLAVLTGLRLYLAESIVNGQGAVYVFLLYSTQALLSCIAGIVPLYLMRLSFRDLVRADVQAEAELAG
ncbi:MAG: lysylphosphatidylglycerol synthase transmembrane domain-containing protein [Sandaracinus sp.]